MCVRRMPVYNRWTSRRHDINMSLRLMNTISCCVQHSQACRGSFFSFIGSELYEFSGLISKAARQGLAVLIFKLIFAIYIADWKATTCI